MTIRADLRPLEEVLALSPPWRRGKTGEAHRFEGDNQEVIREDGINSPAIRKRDCPKRLRAMVEEANDLPFHSGSNITDCGSSSRQKQYYDSLSQLACRFTPSENKDPYRWWSGGGTVRHKTHSMHGTIAERSLHGISADVMFVGAMVLMRQTVLPRLTKVIPLARQRRRRHTKLISRYSTRPNLTVAALNPCIADGQDRLLCGITDDTISKQIKRASAVMRN